MGWWGKVVGGTLGLLAGGPLGAMVGATMGHGVDRGVDHVAGLFAPQRAAERARLQQVFLATTFAVLGHLAKSDGRVSESEIAFAESVMGRMGLNRLMRRTAIGCFNQGKSADFDLNAAVTAFRQASTGQTQLHRLFLEIQLAAAYMDGEPTPTARLVLEQCRNGLQVPLASFRRLEQLILFQHGILGATGGWRAGGGRPGWERQGAGQPSARTSLAGAYTLLGITPQANDEEVKRAYRKLMNRHHPDKLMSRGAPEQAIKMASQKTHEIRRAYETITQARA